MTHNTSTHVHNPDPPSGITLAELGPNDCRFPFGDREFNFCGQTQQEGSSYCSVHHAICWVKPLPNRRAGRIAA